MRRLGFRVLFWLVLLVSLRPCPPTFSQVALRETEVPSLSSDVLQAVERVFPSRPGDLFVQLRNGLTVLIREIHTSRVVSTQVLVKTGSIYEGEYFNGGLSHYLEHIVAGGTTSRFTEEEAKRILQSIGGASNAYTSYDRTVYFIDTTSSHYTTALRLLLSFVTESLIAPGEFERERQVIQQEMKLGENNPGRQRWRLFMKTAYLVHPVRHPVIGYEDVFVRISRDQLYKYYKTRYIPQNMVVAIVGDVDSREALGEVIRLVGNRERSFQRPIVIPEEPPQVGPRKVEKQLATARLTSVTVGFPSVTLKHPDLYPLDVLAIIMGSGRTSRLYKRLKDRDEAVLSVSAFDWTPSFARGVFGITMSLERANQERAMGSLWEEIERLQDHLVKRREIEKAKRQVVADRIFGNQSASAMASSLASSYVATGDPYFDERYVDRIQEVTRKDIRRVARHYLGRDKMTVAVVTPPQKVVPTKSTQAPRFSEKPRVVKRILLNGMTLLIKKNDTLPVVSFQLFGKGGLLFEPPDRPGISNFTFSLLTKGTRSRSKLEIAEAMEDIGGTIRSGSGRNTFFVGVDVLKEDFDRGLEILADVVTHPSFPAEEIEKQRKDTLLAIQRIDESWEREVERLFRKKYYQDHPYGNDVIGTKESIAALDRDEIVAFYRRLVRSGNIVLAIFGDIDNEKVEGKVAKAFRDLPPGRIEPPRPQNEGPRLRHNDRVEKPTEKVSAGIFVGYNGMTIFDGDRAAMDVIDAIVSGIGYPSGWLHEALRGGKTSLVYYVHAFPSYGIDTGHFGVITQTTMRNYRRVVETILEKMDQIRNSPVSDAELERGKDMVVTMHELENETNADQAYQAALWEALGLGFDWGERYLERVKRVTQEDILRVARKYFQYHLIVSTIPRHPVDTVIPPPQGKEGIDIQ